MELEAFNSDARCESGIQSSSDERCFVERLHADQQTVDGR